MKTFPSLSEDPDIMEVYKQFEQFQESFFSQIESFLKLSSLCEASPNSRLVKGR